MTTPVRVPNKAGWALDECLIEHDPELAELLVQLLAQMEKEREIAINRFDKNAQLRLADLLMTVAKLQIHFSRLTRLHQLARHNEYDRHEEKAIWTLQQPTTN